MEEETLLQSLSYFADGLEHSLNAIQPAASQTDFDLIRPTSEASSASASFPAFSTACQSLLKKRTLAMNTKQSLGLLAPEEERLEHLLSAQVTTFLQNLRLNTAASPLAGFRSMLRTRQNDLEAGRQPLLTRFHAVLDFLLREFSDSLETGIFASELLNTPQTEHFLKKYDALLHNQIKDLTGE